MYKGYKLLQQFFQCVLNHFKLNKQLVIFVKCVVLNGIISCYFSLHGHVVIILKNFNEVYGFIYT